jgi:hypothetical protein
MARLILAGAAVAFLATPALAAPGLGSSSWSASGENTAREVESKGASLVDLILSLYGVSFDKQISSSKPGKSTRGDPNAKAYECEQSKKAEQEKIAEAKKQRVSGPEPVYLAF